jgi:hypothetical protein
MQILCLIRPPVYDNIALSQPGACTPSSWWSCTKPDTMHTMPNSGKICSSHRYAGKCLLVAIATALITSFPPTVFLPSPSPHTFPFPLPCQFRHSQLHPPVPPSIPPALELNPDPSAFPPLASVNLLGAGFTATPPAPRFSATT